MSRNDSVLPKWFTALRQQYLDGQLHSFVVYGNVWDDFVSKGQLERIYDVLAKEPPFAAAAIVAYFNTTTGLRFADDNAEEPLMEALFLELDITTETDFTVYKRNFARVLDWVDELLRIGWQNPILRTDRAPKLLEGIQEKVGANQKEGGKTPFAVVIFEYVETMVPPDSASSSAALDRKALVSFQWWAQERIINQNGNVVIYISEALNSIAPELRDETRGFYPLKVNFPDEDDLSGAIAILRNEFPAKEGDVQSGSLAQLAKGLSLVGLKNILSTAHYSADLLSADMVFRKKAKLIQEMTGGLLRIRHSPWTYETIGGLDHIVSYFRQVVASMKAGDFMAVPSGILLMGAPGTGKTVAAEATAHEAGLPFAEFGSTRDPYVGMSERNMELSLEILRANAPVIVFQDEIDNFFLRRGSVWHGDSGVSARLTGMLMEFLSDSTLRGKVLWIGATNRPDLLDTALIRSGRFDDKIPFFIPTAKERVGIITALLHKQCLRAQEHNQQFRYELSEDEIRKMADMFDFWVKDGELVAGPPPEKRTTIEKIPLTGAEIEVVIERADARARRTEDCIVRFEHLEYVIQRFLPTRNVKEYLEMDKLALLHADNLDLIPEHLQKRARQLRLEESERGEYGASPRSLM